MSKLIITRQDGDAITIGQRDRGIRLDVSVTPDDGIHVEAYDWSGKPLDLLVMSAGMLDEDRQRRPHPEVVFAYAPMATGIRS